mmetsp:Transcript_17405/g.54361  ORF Transcript_17405/g.54361 Transcript_17405/m.54361 type:complete len:324 (+) Transcript_17405:34-1005(+)
MPAALVRLGRWPRLGEAVAEDAGEGEGGAGELGGREVLAEEEDRGGEDEDALGGVGDGLLDGAEEVEDLEGALVRGVVGEARDEDARGKARGLVEGAEGGEGARRVDEEGGRGEDERRAAGEKRVIVGGADFPRPFDFGRHESLREELCHGEDDGAHEGGERRGRGEIGRAQPSPRLRRRDRDAHDDREEREIRHAGGDLPCPEKADDGPDDRFARLDDGNHEHASLAERGDLRRVASRVEQGDWSELLPDESRRDDRPLPQPEHPQRDEPGHARDELEPRDHPRVRKFAHRLLVHQVEHRVPAVPPGEVQGQGDPSRPHRVF